MPEQTPFVSDLITRLRRALLNAFDYDGFQILLGDLGIDIERIAPVRGATFEVIVDAVVRHFQKESGGAQKLLDAACKARSGDIELTTLAREWVGDDPVYNQGVPIVGSQRGVQRDPQSWWLEQHKLESNPFGSHEPTDDSSGNWSGYVVDPQNLIGSLRQLGDMRLVFGGQGSGKSLFCKVLADDCWPEQGAKRRVAVLFRQKELSAMAKQCIGVGRLPDQLDFIASVAVKVHKLVESEKRPLPNSQTGNLLAGWRDLDRTCTAVLGRAASSSGASDPIEADDLRDQLMDWLATLGLDQVLVLVDEFKETVQELGLSGQAISYFDLVKAVIQRRTIWQGRKFCCIVFLCAECRASLAKQPFFQGYFPPRVIQWDAKSLINMLDERVRLYEKSRSPSAAFYGLLDNELKAKIGGELFRLAESRPDLALEIAAQLIETHCCIPNPPLYIGIDSWADVRKAWRHEKPQREGDIQELYSFCAPRPT